MIKFILPLMLLSSCTVIPIKSEPLVAPDSIMYAKKYVGLQETNDKAFLQSRLGINPSTIEWCAAFVNTILKEQNIPGSESVSDNPLMARSFLAWGTRVEREDRKRGDVVIFSRGSSSWQGHVGFYVGSAKIDGVEQWLILGGNQDDSVSYALYSASTVIDIRRAEEK